MAHAHEHGVTHRDLKPGNIMIAKDGAPKILDFGLARIQSEIQNPKSQIDPNAPTVTMKPGEEAEPPRLTTPGLVMGTLPYMSPEQAEGRAVDARSDLFSFGVIMYEAITGQRPFKGDSQASLIWFRDLAQLDSRIIPESEGAGSPFWSPNSDFIGYFAEGAMRKYSIASSNSAMLCATPEGYEMSATWGEKGNIIVNTSLGGSASTELFQCPIRVVNCAPFSSLTH